jgi:hypothetical protein
MAAAAVSRIRKTNTIDRQGSFSHVDNILPQYLLEFPEMSSRIKDLQLAVLHGRWVAAAGAAVQQLSEIVPCIPFPEFSATEFDSFHPIRRTWQMRRFVYTKDVIAFSRPEEDILLDAVPLAEVIGIDSLKQSDDDVSINNFEASVDFSHAFQIRTKKDGFNSGRKYFIRTSSDEVMTEIVTEISEIAKAVANKLATKSKWAKIQNRVRLVYNSRIFQGVAAFLIIAVKFWVSCHSPLLMRPLTTSRAPSRRTSARR